MSKDQPPVTAEFARKYLFLISVICWELILRLRLLAPLRMTGF
jgi:hypothetical protein